MADIKSIEKIVAKWATVTPQRTGDYSSGLTSPRRSWEQATVDAAQAQAQGVQDAIARGAFAKGVAKAGQAKYLRKATGVGAQRFGQGVQAAKSDYQAGFTPYVSVIQGVNLPPRGPKGDPRNYERVSAIGDALHQAKIGK